MNKNSLLVRLAVVMIFASLSVGFISANIFYRLTYLNEVEIANQEISQLFHTVASTASLAAYLEDKELASELANGIITNNVVQSAQVILDVADTSKLLKSNDNTHLFDLYSPFEKQKLVGHLAITPNLTHIENRANQIGMSNVTMIVIQSAVTTLVAIFIAFILITKPMARVASNLHETTPGASNRMMIPEFHSNSELGVLVDDINILLEKSELQFSDERVLRQELETLEKHFRMLFENSISPIVLVEPRGSILLLNDSFRSLLGRINVSLKKNFGPLLEELMEQPGQLQNAVDTALVNDEISIGEYKLKQKNNNDDVWVQVVVTSIKYDDLKEYYQITLHDISRRRKELELLSQRANYDQLTQLYNRHATENKLEKYISEKVPFAFILIDLNKFKDINDHYGHDSGDEILVHVAKQLNYSLRNDDISCRWGGDEFVLLLRETNKDGVKIVANKILSRITEPYLLQNHTDSVSVGISMGVSFFPEDEIDKLKLIRLADKAMYSCKNSASENSFINFFNEI